MTVKLFCNRCDDPGDITTRTFKTGITATVNQQDQSPSHLCPGCLAAAMLDAVVSMADTPTAIDYAQVKQRASEASRAYAQVERITEERDELKEKLLEAKSEATQTGRYDAWLQERGELLKQIDALQAQCAVTAAQTAHTQRTAAEQAKRTAGRRQTGRDRRQARSRLPGGDRGARSQTSSGAIMLKEFPRFYKSPPPLDAVPPAVRAYIAKLENELLAWTCVVAQRRETLRAAMAAEPPTKAVH